MIARHFFAWVRRAKKRVAYRRKEGRWTSKNTYKRIGGDPKKKTGAKGKEVDVRYFFGRIL